MQFRQNHIFFFAISIIFFVVALPFAEASQPNDNQKSASLFSGQTFASASVLSTGQWAKIKVSSTGIYKITFEQLKQMGVTNPQNVHIHGYGGAMLPENFAMTFLDDLPENGIYIGGDYILFYAQGPVSWQYDSTKKAFTHTANPYCNNGYYFVTQNSTPAKQISAIAAETATPTTTVDYFLDYNVHESDLLNVSTSGREFYGEKFSTVTTSSFSFSFPNTDVSRTGKVNVNAIAVASASSSYTTKLGATTLGTFYISALGTYDNAQEGKGFYNFTPTGDNSSIALTYNKPNDASYGYLNYIELNVYRKLVMTNAAMSFRNPDYINQGQVLQYSLTAAGSNIKVWNVTDPQNIKEVTVTRQSQSLSFVASSQQLQEYLAIDPTQSSAFGAPEIVQTNVPNQNLHGLAQTDMVIISPAAFVSEAERLAQKHRDKDNLSVVVVTSEQTYNEFSSGTADATAYRRLMKMFYNRALAGQGSAPQYLLLFGRGCYDNKGLTSVSAPYRKLLYFESSNSLSQVNSYFSDDYFGFLGDNTGVNLSSDKLDIGVGRFPIITLDQAKATVDKVIGYMDNTNTGYWKNQVCFVADDGDSNLHVTQADTIAKWTTAANPYVQVTKLYLDAFKQITSSSGESYPVAKEKLLNMIKSGLLMLNYTGHGSHINLANEAIITNEDILSMYNKKLAMWVTATCDFTRCDFTEVAAGENVFLNPNGGGIALFTTSRTVFSSDNFAINKQFAKNVFYKDASGDALRLGDIMRLTKNALPGNDNKLNFLLIGDPALKLAFPAPNYTVMVDSINNLPTTQTVTVNALGKLVVKGHVNLQDNSGICSDFNGYVQVVIFDKVETLSTLANDAGSTPYVYQDRPNVLFSGKAEVKNGRFTIESIIPKDIDYKFGTGRMNFYAADDKGREGQGDFTGFLVGGSNSAIQWEQNGPVIDLYLNTQAFKSGDKVNETPLFLADVTDETGINTVGNGIGHDMTITIDQDPSNYYIVNSYFEPTVGDYRSGSVQYLLPTLSDGKHTLTFKVWDVLNNSSSKTIDFVVQKGLAPSLFKVYNYPNPVVNGSTNFVLVHDRPDAVLSLRVSVYDLSGRMLKVLSANTSTESTTTVVPWDVTDSSGTRLRAGLYLYRVDVSMKNGDVASKTQKVLVAKQ